MQFIGEIIHGGLKWKWWSSKMIVPSNKMKIIIFNFVLIRFFFSCAVIKYPLNIRYISIHYQVFVKWIVQKYILYQEMYCNRCLKSKISFLKCYDIKRHDYTKINHRMKNYYFCCNYHVSLLEVHIRKPCMKMNKLRFK